MHPTESALDSALIKQKDNICKLINEEEYELALAALMFNRDLWEICNYGYKFHELQSRIQTACALCPGPSIKGK